MYISLLISTDTLDSAGFTQSQEQREYGASIGFFCLQKDGFCYFSHEALDSLLCFFSGDTTSNKTGGRSIGYALPPLPTPATC